MVDRIGAELNFSSVSNAKNTKLGEMYLGFEKVLTEKTVSNKVVRHGYVGDGQDLCPEINEESIKIINALLSLTDDLENIWEIVLRLEEKADIEVLSESIVKDFDNVMGRNSAAALLTRFWKKKELLGEDISEDSVEISTYFDQSYIERNKAASELEALIHKNKERKFITALNSNL